MIRKPIMHNLKTWPMFYQHTVDDLKLFEVRENDRKFQVGDLLKLEEYDIVKKEYTGRSTVREITYILEGGQFGIEKNFCVMGVKHPELIKA